MLVGLANPGPEYANTRHNAGAWFIEQLAARYNCTLKHDPKYHGLTGKVIIQGQEFKLLIPTTYMNLSGKAVSSLANFFKIPVENILVAHDEMDLEPGVAKLKKGGGHGGHNGLKDIQAQLKTVGYPRFRFGISNEFSKGRQVDYVLGEWSEEEESQMKERLDTSVELIKSFGTAGVSITMNTFNGK